jgi:hypothetical protein
MVAAKAGAETDMLNLLMRPLCVAVRESHLDGGGLPSVARGQTA